MQIPPKKRNSVIGLPVTVINQSKFFITVLQPRIKMNYYGFSWETTWPVKFIGMAATLKQCSVLNLFFTVV